MLTNRDREFMKDTIDDILHDSDQTIDIWIMKPADQQVGYNDLLQENPNPQESDYTILIGVLADIVSNPMMDIVVDSPSGTKVTGRLVFHLPAIHTKDGIDYDLTTVGANTIFKYLGDTWKPDYIRTRLGEIIVTASRLL